MSSFNSRQNSLSSSSKKLRNVHSSLSEKGLKMNKATNEIMQLNKASVFKNS